MPMKVCDISNGYGGVEGDDPARLAFTGNSCRATTLNLSRVWAQATRLAGAAIATEPASWGARSIATGWFLHSLGRRGCLC
jgi:hypothetical protein